MNELKERILKEVNSSRFAYYVASSEIQEHFSLGELDKWASDNALVYMIEGSNFVFAISPSLSAIRAMTTGFREGLNIGGNQ